MVLILKKGGKRGFYNRAGYFDTESWVLINRDSLLKSKPLPLLHLDQHWEQSCPITEDDYLESYGEGIFSIAIV